MDKRNKTKKKREILQNPEFRSRTASALIVCLISMNLPIPGNAAELPLVPDEWRVPMATASDAERVLENYATSADADAADELEKDTEVEDVDLSEETANPIPIATESNVDQLEEDELFPDLEFATSSDAWEEEHTAADGWVILPVPFREYYDFVEWNTEPDGSGESYQAGEEIRIRDMELYAVWEEAMVIGEDFFWEEDDEELEIATRSNAEKKAPVATSSNCEGMVPSKHKEPEINVPELPEADVWKRTDGIG